jgi:y4mF family transcriptional regulator
MQDLACRWEQDMSIPLRNPDDIAVLVKDQRQFLGLTQADLAASAGVSLRWLAGLEAGSPGASIDKVMRTLDALDITLGVDVSSIDDDGRPSAGDQLDAILRDHTRQP